VTGAIALAWSEFPAATAAQLRWAFTYAHGGRRSTVTPPLLDAWAAYHVSETRHLDSQPTSTEPTFYPVTKTLLSAILKEGRLPFEVRVNTSETKGKAHDMPDFVLGDDKMFVGVYGEVKRANVLLEDLALSTEQNDQIGRYLARPTCGVLVYWRARRAILGLWFRAAGQASASKSPNTKEMRNGNE
jgi:hypothetical protein